MRSDDVRGDFVLGTLNLHGSYLTSFSPSFWLCSCFCCFSLFCLFLSIRLSFVLFFSFLFLSSFCLFFPSCFFPLSSRLSSFHLFLGYQLALPPHWFSIWVPGWLFKHSLNTGSHVHESRRLGFIKNTYGRFWKMWTLIKPGYNPAPPQYILNHCRKKHSQ